MIRPLSGRRRSVVVLQVQDTESTNMFTVLKLLRQAFDPEIDLGIQNLQICRIY